ncbi:uncharacterized protein LOC118460466 [Anopheles albimanus]|uniref:uncharacterized protein LOC118460466 n=1 Tax=Anopheles albimanus TaxID=7167 RepID=UPI00163FFD78|nr:uncharacterized protein LOC118460466 [Anopheles albimanus]
MDRHGFFREYLNVKKLTRSPNCTRCPGQNVVDSVEHAMFECPRFSDVRVRLLAYGTDDPVTADTLQEVLLQDGQRWQNISQACREILSVLQQLWNNEQERETEVRTAEAVSRLAADAQMQLQP